MISGTAVQLPRLGLGAGWRPELARAIELREDINFVEITAENFSNEIPPALRQLHEDGVHVVPHGISLSLGGADTLDERRLEHLALLAEKFKSPLVSEHIAFVRAGGVEAGHLLPVARTRDSLGVLIENVRAAQAFLPVPFALENISALFEWPDAQMSEAQFVTELLHETGAMLLLDIANVYANAQNLRMDARTFLAELPLERVAYVHVGGGYVQADGTYVDSHAHGVAAPVFELLDELCGMCAPGGVLLERDDQYPTHNEWNAEMDQIASSWNRVHAVLP
ncbi:MAG: DUF692 domain-containing protein [Candidatus Sumerlaeaceae bacterium]